MEERGGDVKSQGGYRVGCFEIPGDLDDELRILTGKMVLQLAVEAKGCVDVGGKLSLSDVVSCHALILLS